MLQSLQIKNLALIDELDIVFSDGFHILTGETGAGKSIIIDAVNFVLGERASRDLIQTGAERACVEAAFLIDHSPALLTLLEELGISHEPGDTFIVSRSYTLSGKNTIRANGSLINLSALSAISELLVDVHGQHEHQSLLHQPSHIRFLDNYGDTDIRPVKTETSKIYTRIQQIERELNTGFASEQDRARQLDMLSYQIQEISDAKLCPGEEEALDERLRVLSNAQQIRAALELAHETLAGEFQMDMGGAVLANINAASHAVQEIVSFSREYEEVHTTLQDAYYTLEDAAHSLRNLKDSVEVDPSLMEEVETRISLIQTLKRKYGNTIEEILQYLHKSQIEYENIIGSAQRREELMKELAALRDSYTTLAAQLTDKRRIVSERLERELLAQLVDLGMENAQFSVCITTAPPSSEGVDHVEFLLSANKGEPVKPLRRVASGGELSRIMLAFKTIQFGSISTIIFDEIDSGISGQVAGAVGAKMLQIAKGHQVLCVTHLAQIAAMANIHYFVEKVERDGHTLSIVTTLDHEGRVRELARIMGASEQDIQAHNHARELLERAGAVK